MSALHLVMTSQPDRAARLRAAALRDGQHCVWCRRPCTGLVRATTDHLIPKVKGGPSWLENEVVACGRCNRERGHLSPADWIAECERRGWEPTWTPWPGHWQTSNGRSPSAAGSAALAPTSPRRCGASNG